MAEKVKVLKPFRDGQDKKHPYGQKGFYPRDGYEPTNERFNQLAELGYTGKRKEKEKFDENNTNDELRSELDRRGVDWNTNDNKKELLAKLDDSDDSK